MRVSCHSCFLCRAECPVVAAQWKSHASHTVTLTQDKGAGLCNHMFSLPSFAGSLLRLAQPSLQPAQTALGALRIFSRARSQLAPRQVKHIKRHKGRVPIPTGGSTKGTTLAYGDYGIRIKGNGQRLTAKQLSTAEEVIKRKARVLKGLKVHLRVFPDIPVCIKVRDSADCMRYRCDHFV